jgi:hypothetical protein
MAPDDPPLEPPPPDDPPSPPWAELEPLPEQPMTRNKLPSANAFFMVDASQAWRPFYER